MGVLLLDGLYGLLLVVIHALLLGEADTNMIEDSHGKDVILRNAKLNHWFLQLVDLDVAWGHELLGFEDYSLFIGGLVYGIVIILLCAFMLHTVLTTTAHTMQFVSRWWFVAFLHFEIILYCGLAFAKYPKLCEVREEFMPLLSTDCDVLRFTFLERAGVRGLLGSVCCWIFSSFVYLLGQNDPVIDDPKSPEGTVDYNDTPAQPQHKTLRSLQGSKPFFSSPPPYAPLSNSSFHHSPNYTRYMPSSSSNLAQYVMPRATSHAQSRPPYTIPRAPSHASEAIMKPVYAH